MECYRDDDESTELLLPAVEISEGAKSHQLFRMRTRLQRQYKEYRDIGQDKHERQKQEAEGVIVRSRAEYDSESSESDSSSDSEVEEGGFKKWVTTALYTPPDEGGFKAWKTPPEDAAVDEGGFRARKTTKEDGSENKWRFGRTSTGEKATETCAPQ